VIDRHHLNQQGVQWMDGSNLFAVDESAKGRLSGNPDG
jgi:hypothetical protein